MQCVRASPESVKVNHLDCTSLTNIREPAVCLHDPPQRPSPAGFNRQGQQGVKVGCEDGAGEAIRRLVQSPTDKLSELQGSGRDMPIRGAAVAIEVWVGAEFA